MADCSVEMKVALMAELLDGSKVGRKVARSADWLDVSWADLMVELLVVMLVVSKAE